MSLAPGPADTAANRGFADAPWVKSVLGVGVLLAVLTLAEPLVFGHGYYAQLSLHPYWIVILLAAVQHGLYVGLASVAMASALIDWPARPVGVDPAAHYADLAVLPVQWLCVAAIIGLYRQAQLREQAEARAEAERLRDTNAMLAREMEVTEAALAQHERVAAAAPATETGPDDDGQDTRAHRAREGGRTEDTGHTRACAEAELEAFNASLPALAALAGARGTDLPEAFAEAAAAYCPVPAALILADPDAPTLIFGATDALGDDPDAVARAILAALDGNAGPMLLPAAAAGLDGGGSIACQGFAQTEETRLRSAVVAVAGDDAEAAEVKPRLTVLGSMASIAIDRLSRDLGVGALPDDEADAPGTAEADDRA